MSHKIEKLAQVSMDATPWRLLVVDDEAMHRSLLLEVFEEEGAVAREAATGFQALEILEKESFDLLLLDNNMPGMTGLELCARLRQDPRFQDMPIILVTALNTPIILSQGLSAGADDFIGKPYSPMELSARVRSHLVRARMQKMLRHLHDRLRVERELMERLIGRMRVASHQDDRGLSWIMTSVERATGDLVLSEAAPDGSQFLLVADCTGHGLPAAMVSPLLTYIFSTQVKLGRSLRQIIHEINRELCMRTPPDLYLAAHVVVLDPGRRNLTVFNGGMPEGLMVGRDRGWREIVSNNLPLGILAMEEHDFQTESFSLEGHEVFYFFSDGIMDQLGLSGERFGLERIRDFLLGEQDGERGLNQVLEALKAFCGNSDFDDDVTIVCLNLAV